MPKTGAEKSETKKRPFVIVTAADAESRFMLRSLLEMWDYDVVESDGGPASVAAASEHRPDLILMDAGLPYVESLETMSYIKGNLSVENVPLVVVSGFSLPDMVEAAMLNGATDFLVKPLDYESLPGYLNRVIAGH